MIVAYLHHCKIKLMFSDFDKFTFEGLMYYSVLNSRYAKSHSGIV